MIWLLDFCHTSCVMLYNSLDLNLFICKINGAKVHPSISKILIGNYIFIQEFQNAILSEANGISNVML